LSAALNQRVSQVIDWLKELFFTSF
jgi:hypothetical protein